VIGRRWHLFVVAMAGSEQLTRLNYGQAREMPEVVNGGWAESARIVSGRALEVNHAEDP